MNENRTILKVLIPPPTQNKRNDIWECIFNVVELVKTSKAGDNDKTKKEQKEMLCFSLMPLLDAGYTYDDIRELSGDSITTRDYTQASKFSSLRQNFRVRNLQEVFYCQNGGSERNRP